MRLLVVSAGSIGRRHIRVARELLPEAQIAVLRRPDSASRTKPEGADFVFADLEQAVDFAPAIAIVSTPAPLRLPVASKLMRSGAHLLLEKPLASQFAEAKAFLSEAAKTESIIRVGYNLRFTPILADVREKIANGDVGEPRIARFEVGQYLPDWRPGADYRTSVSAQASLGGGVLLELSHEIDLAIWFLGAPNSVLASLGQVGDLEIDVEDHASLVLERPGLSTTVQLDFLQRVPRRRLLIIGSEATLELDMIAQTGVVHRPGGDIAISTPKTLSGDETYSRQLDAFCAEALESYAPRYPSVAAGADLADAMSVMEVVDAARRSSSAGVKIQLGKEDATS